MGHSGWRRLFLATNESRGNDTFENDAMMTSDDGHLLFSLFGSDDRRTNDADDDEDTWLEQGVWAESPVTHNSRDLHADVTCGTLSPPVPVTCTPAPDAWNPCEDVMSSWLLRVAVWFVAIFAIFGNMLVVVVALCSKHTLTVQKFLVCNLAISDFLLGVYLLLLASVDAATFGTYYSHAIWWQFDGGCDVLGFIAVFATSLSVLTLVAITMERWYAIRHALNRLKRLRMRQAVVVMAVVWMHSAFVAALPLLGVSSYSNTSICLPMEVTRDSKSRVYVIALLLTNLISFLVICACYLEIYLRVRSGRDYHLSQNTAFPHHINNDATIAKRMALLVFTDFVCLAPILFFAISAALGFPLISVTQSKILLVFFFPINSCVNPLLYAISTHQFSKDLLSILGACGFCEKTIARQRALEFGSWPMSGVSNPRNSLSGGVAFHAVSTTMTSSRSDRLRRSSQMTAATFHLLPSDKVQAK